MSDLDELEQRRCDFCETAWDPDLDEPMQPLRIGSIPQPQPVHARGVQDNDTESWSHSGKSKLDAIVEAMDEMDGLTYDFYESVLEVRAIGGEVHFAKTTEDGQMYTESPPADDRMIEDYDKTAAELRFQPEPREVEPDAMVCQECAKMFQSLGE